MAEEDRVRETALRLRRLVDEIEMGNDDRVLASSCLRRLEQPLRLTVFGTDIGHAVSLLNLILGQVVIAPTIKRARIQFVYGEEAYARLLFRDGSQKRIEGSEFRRLFEENPNRMRIYVDLPVLRKVSVMVAADQNPKALCSDADKTLQASDITLWAGSEFQEPMRKTWQALPQRLKDHSYLTLAPGMDDTTWSEVEDEFAGAFRVAPRRAQQAKSHPEGVDKAAFREAGGTELVKTMKSEIDILVRSAIDAGELLLMRYEKELAALAEPAEPKTPEITAGDALELVSQMQRPEKDAFAPLAGLAEAARATARDVHEPMANDPARVSPAAAFEPAKPVAADDVDMDMADEASDASGPPDLTEADEPLATESMVAGEAPADELRRAVREDAAPSFDFGAAFDASFRAKSDSVDLVDTDADQPDAPGAEPKGSLPGSVEDDRDTSDIEALIARVGSAPSPEPETARSVELGKVASRSRLLGYSGAREEERPPLPGFASEGMPLRARPMSKLNAQSRVRSRTSRPSATPWSLDL